MASPAATCCTPGCTIPELLRSRQLHQAWGHESVHTVLRQRATRCQRSGFRADPGWATVRSVTIGEMAATPTSVAFSTSESNRPCPLRSDTASHSSTEFSPLSGCRERMLHVASCVSRDSIRAPKKVPAPSMTSIVSPVLYLRTRRWCASSPSRMRLSP